MFKMGCWDNGIHSGQLSQNSSYQNKISLSGDRCAPMSIRIRAYTHLVISLSKKINNNIQNRSCGRMAQL